METTIKKNKEGYGYCYTDLAQINKYCEENEITYTQSVETNSINGLDYIITNITKDGNTTQHRGCQIVEAKLSGINNPVQAYGSSLTYCRRYSLLMALGLATDDNDAQDLTMPSITTEEEARNYKLTFGKYAGKTLGEVEERYLQWLFENSKDETIKTACDLLMKHTTSEDIDKLTKLNELLDKTETDREKFYEAYKVKSNAEMTPAQIDNAIEILEKRVK